MAQSSYHEAITPNHQTYPDYSQEQLVAHFSEHICRAGHITGALWNVCATVASNIHADTPALKPV